ncbi:MAG: biotin--[acetyl-CoA-carboxylase] ligase [Hyphomicrobiaceae bacterium]
MPEQPDPASLVRIVWLDEIDSTNLEAQRRAAAGERGPLWLAARWQTAGRGRAGRAWQSSGGNLAATLLLALDAAPVRLPELSFVAALAAHDAIAQALADTPSTRHIRLKWPNDVLISGEKICGILLETAHYGGTAVMMFGIGINVESAPDVAGRSVTALKAHGATVDATRALQWLAAAMERWLSVWHSPAGFAAIRKAWLARSLPLGAPMSIDPGSGPIRGTFAGLDNDGALLLANDDGGTRRFTHGDVAIVPAKA